MKAKMVLVLILVVGTNAALANLANPGFETYPDGIDVGSGAYMPTGYPSWSWVQNGTGSYLNVYEAGGYQRTGNGAFRLFGDIAYSATLSQTATVANGTYDVEAWVNVWYLDATAYMEVDGQAGPVINMVSTEWVRVYVEDVVISDGTLDVSLTWNSGTGTNCNSWVDDFAVIPEPATITLLGVGASLFLCRRK